MNVWKIWPIRLWWIGFLAMAGLIAAFYLVLSHREQASITGKLQRREATIARAGASNLASFFEVFGESVAVFSQLSSMESLGAKTREDMRAFVVQWRDIGLIGGVLLTDSNGMVQLNSNVLGTSDVGISVADRDYFVWAKGMPQEGEYFVGKPVVSRLGATKDQVIVPVAAPVYQNKTFVGAISTSVKLQPLTKRYLELIKISERTAVHLIDQRGDLLYSSSGDSQTLIDNIKKTLDITKEGQLQTEGYSIAYSPVLLGSQNWLLIVASPVQEAFSLSVPFYIRQVAVLVWVSLTTLLFGVMVGRRGQNK